MDFPKRRWEGDYSGSVLLSMGYNQLQVFSLSLFKYNYQGYDTDYNPQGLAQSSISSIEFSAYRYGQNFPLEIRV